VGSARALDRLCKEHDAYRWLLGGVTVNYHTPADFRVEQGEVLDRLLTEGVAALMAEAASSPVKTFAIGFSGEPSYDETAHARVVAQHLGADQYQQA